LAATGPIVTDVAKVPPQQDMIDREIAFHLNAYKTSGAELIMGSGRFVGPRKIEVALNDGGSRALTGSKVVIDVRTHAAIPSIPGLEAARPLTHIEALELDIPPPHLVVLGGGYVRNGSGLSPLRQPRDGHRGQGFMKVVVGGDDDSILGFTMIGSQADEVLAAVQIARCWRTCRFRSFATPS